MADLAQVLAGGRLAMALVDAVPAGIYGRAALEHLGQWDALAPHVVETDNVRAALALVAVGAVPMGLVYATDAAAEPRVSVRAEVSPDSHPKIVYPGALLRGASPPAAAFLDYLSGADAGDLFRRHGFEVLP